MFYLEILRPINKKPDILNSVFDERKPYIGGGDLYGLKKTIYFKMFSVVWYTTALKSLSS